ncbi:conserved hypothetical protein [Azospirillaceae bacterium]
MLGLISYDKDFFAWTQEQSRILTQAGNNQQEAKGIDYLNVAREIEGLGRKRKRAVQWAIVRITENLLKLQFSSCIITRDAWEEVVVANRFLVNDDFSASPSLRHEVDIVRAYRDARRMAMVNLETTDSNGPRLQLPSENLFTIEQILDVNWWPVNTHRLNVTLVRL